MTEVSPEEARQLADDARGRVRFEEEALELADQVYAVARRRFADAARRDSRRARLSVVSEASVEYGPSVAASLRTAFERLPATQRDVVVLKLLRGASFAEIAAAVGTTEEAARMRFSRALRSVRADLEKEGIEP